MLRASAKATNSTIDLRVITGDDAADGGIPHGSVLTAFAEAVLSNDEARLTDTR